MIIRFIAFPSVEANMTEANMSIVAFDSNMVKSPVMPSSMAPKIFVPLAQNVMATIR